MPLKPNGRNDAIGFNRLRYYGQPSFKQSNTIHGKSIAYHTNAVVDRTSSVPEGAFPSVSILYPIKAGGMSGGGRLSFTPSSANLVKNVLLSGEGAMSFAPDTANLNIIAALSGEGAMSFAGGAADLKAVLFISGNGTMSFVGDNAILKVQVPMAGNGSMSFIGAGNLTGKISLSGSWGGGEVLSPTSLAKAIWAAAATDNNTTGSMGEKLNLAGSGGVDVNALATAVWNFQLENTLTAKGMMRVMFSFQANIAKVPMSAGTFYFRDAANTKDRISGSVDSSGNRTTTIDAS